MGDLETRQRVPLHWAVPIVVALVLPLAFFLGEFNLPVWVSFIVWAEYFALGAKPQTWRLIIPSIPYGATTAALWCASAILIAKMIGGNHGLFWGYVIGNFIFITPWMYFLPRVHAWASGSLAVFNGLTLFLAVYFTGSIPRVGPMTDPYWVVLWSLIWTVLLAYFGWFLGWLNVALTFPTVSRSNLRIGP